MAYYSRPHICQCLTRISTIRGSSVVTVSGDRATTGREFVEQVLSLARGLVEVGVRAGDVVAICAYNSDWYLEWLLAVAFIGGIVAPLNYRWNPGPPFEPDLKGLTFLSDDRLDALNMEGANDAPKYQLTCIPLVWANNFNEAKTAMLSVQPVMLACDGSCNSWNTELNSNDIASLRWHVRFGSSNSGLTMETLKQSVKGSPQISYSWAPEAAVIVCFTSGTTGRPKGVLMSHSALIVQSLAKVALVGYGEDDIYLHTAPLCHIGGLSSAFAMLMVGACHILIPKFEATIAADAIERYSVTSLITVPTMMADMISLASNTGTSKEMQSVTKILNGGGGLSPELIEGAKRCFPRASLTSAYGMTETCSSLTFMSLNGSEPLGKPKSDSLYQPQGVCVGKPAPHVELKICRDGSSSSTGRILTRGPHLMLGYWGRAIIERAAPTRGGEEEWLDTGDVGSIDVRGNLWLSGRANGRIKSGGENVYPEEVEVILLEHPGVSAAVVVGVPDSRLTETVVACIKLKESWQWSHHSSFPGSKQVLYSEKLRLYCRAKNLTGFKVPRKFVLWENPFPFTTTGKIKRDQVKVQVISRLQLLGSNL